MRQLVECVPNFSEGRNTDIIRRIADEIRKHAEVHLLHIDPGRSTNRTVITFAGAPEAVIAAAKDAIAKAQQLIDMKQHRGDHPRIGATDVCPLIPIANISMAETVEYARKLAKEVGEDLGIPVFCYENAAFDEKRKNLANCRSGEYEGLREKLTDAAWRPDFGPKEFTEKVAKSGATIIGARDFLIAVNFNLNTPSVETAQDIAMAVRESGRVLREGNPVTGKIIKNDKNESVRQAGTLRGTKAIGWYIKEYGFAQVSMNITNKRLTPLHAAFEEVSEQARKRGVQVTGTEIIGLVQKQVLLDAGLFYWKKREKNTKPTEKELIETAVKEMGLEDISVFDPDKRIIENLIEKQCKR